MTLQPNGGTWTRWALGIGISVLVAILFGLGACVFSNGIVLAEHGSNIKNLQEQYKSIEGKLDKLLERTRRYTGEPELP